MNVYDVFTFSIFLHTFTQGRNDMHAQKNMNVYDVFTFQCTNSLCRNEYECAGNRNKCFFTYNSLKKSFFFQK